VGCERVLQQLAGAPHRRDLIQRINSLQTQLVAVAAADDFESAALLGTQLKALKRESAQLPLSKEDYFTLGNRHARLVERLTEKCRELALAEDYGALGPLGAKLKELRSAVPPVIDEQRTVIRYPGTIGRSLMQTL
jgi:hypothetical protein